MIRILDTYSLEAHIGNSPPTNTTQNRYYKDSLSCTLCKDSTESIEHVVHLPGDTRFLEFCYRMTCTTMLQQLTSLTRTHLQFYVAAVAILENFVDRCEIVGIM